MEYAAFAVPLQHTDCASTEVKQLLVFFYSSTQPFGDLFSIEF